MPTQAQILHLLFHPGGRLDRAGLLVSAVAIVGLELITMLSVRAGFTSEILRFSIGAVAIWIGLTAVVKRLHDVGVSGWWTLGGAGILCIWTASLAGLFIVAIGTDAFLPGSDAHFALLGLVMLPAVGMTLWLHLAPGEPQTNRFGAVPERRGTDRDVAAWSFSGDR